MLLLQVFHGPAYIARYILIKIISVILVLGELLKIVDAQTASAGLVKRKIPIL